MRCKNIIVACSVTLFILAVSSCGETGSDQEGPYKAYLILKRPDGTVKDFYIGGYSSYLDCASMIGDEASTYDKENQGIFWTNGEFNYGGFADKDAGWDKNELLGAKCLKLTEK